MFARQAPNETPAWESFRKDNIKLSSKDGKGEKFQNQAPLPRLLRGLPTERLSAGEGQCRPEGTAMAPGQRPGAERHALRISGEERAWV